MQVFLDAVVLVFIVALALGATGCIQVGTRLPGRESAPQGIDGALALLFTQGTGARLALHLVRTRLLLRRRLPGLRPADACGTGKQGDRAKHRGGYGNQGASKDCHG